MAYLLCLAYFYIMFIIFHHSYMSYGKQVAMKVVDEPSNYGANLGGYNANNNDQEVKLKMRVKPANFSGPTHLRQLENHCFELTDDTYKWEICPFANVSQHEQSLRWNPYNGILGVWQEWEIENNTFRAMVMNEGDSCGSKYRSTRVYFRCGENNRLLSASEPTTCNYEMIFATPLVCHPHAMLVYPTLSVELRHEWDLLEGQLLNEEITTQGYRNFLSKIFERAGYMMPGAEKEKLIEQAKAEETKAAQEAMADFNTLQQCTDEYNKLREEVRGLKELLELNGISPNDIKKQEQEEEIDDYMQHYRDQQYGDDYYQYGGDH